MNRAIFYIGLGAPGVRLAHISVAAALEFGSYTLTQGEGAWRDDTGAIVREPCAVLDVYTPRGRIACREFAARLARELGEQCVGLRFESGAGMDYVQAQAAV